MFSGFRILYFISIRRSGIETVTSLFSIFLDDAKAIVANLTVSPHAYIATHPLFFDHYVIQV